MAEKPTSAQIEKAARDLLDALDRMHGRTSLSLNVCTARDKLRAIFPRKRQASDATREAA